MPIEINGQNVSGNYVQNYTAALDYSRSVDILSAVTGGKRYSPPNNGFYLITTGSAAGVCEITAYVANIAPMKIHRKAVQAGGETFTVPITYGMEYIIGVTGTTLTSVYFVPHSLNVPISLTGPVIAAAFEGTFTDNAGFHNSIYRGKFLGNSVTDAQWQAISSGTFKDLFIGDYWTINDINWRIGAFDYYYQQGYDGAAGPKMDFHHALIVPDRSFEFLNMNDLEEYQEGGVTKTREKKTGYYNSKMKQTHLPRILTQYIEPAFGASHIKETWTNMSTTANQTYGYPNGGLWKSGKCELMTQAMVYGCIPFTDSKIVHPDLWIYYSIKTQLPLFRYNVELQCSCSTSNFWLQDIAFPGGFALADGFGYTSCWSASLIGGVRPCFCIS